METKTYECNSCGFLVRIAAKQEEPLFCPFCRSGMFRVEKALPASDQTEYTCDECRYAFSVPAAQKAPYKCPHCNYTFPRTPGRQATHRL